MTRHVGVFGAGGRRGSSVCQAVAADSSLQFVAGVEVAIDFTKQRHVSRWPRSSSSTTTRRWTHRRAPPCSPLSGCATPRRVGGERCWAPRWVGHGGVIHGGCRTGAKMRGACAAIVFAGAAAGRARRSTPKASGPPCSTRKSVTGYSDHSSTPATNHQPRSSFDAPSNRSTSHSPATQPE